MTLPPVVTQASDVTALLRLGLREVMLATTCVLLACLLGGYVVQALDAAPIRRHLLEAFASGELQDLEFRPTDTRIGVHQFNDCLIFEMAIYRPGTALDRAISPAWWWPPPPGRPSPCRDLHHLLDGTAPAAHRIYWYHQYVHAFRIPTALLLTQLPVATLRRLLLLAGATLALVAGPLGLVRRLRRPEANAGYLAFCGTLAPGLWLFQGPAYFGASVSHAYFDLLTSALCIACMFGAGWLFAAPARLLRLAALYGALAGALEFLSGPLPLGLAVIAVLTAWGLRQASLAAQFRLTLAAIVCFTGAALGILVLKWLLVFALYGRDAMRGIYYAFLKHVDDGQVGYADVWLALAGHVHHIGFGMPSLGLAMLALGGSLLLLVVHALWQRDELVLAATILLAALVLPLWFAVFCNHTVGHAEFMARLLGLIPALGLAAGAGLLQGRHSRPQPARQ